MSQKQTKQTKQKKCRITEEQLLNRFNEADIDGNGYLSADQITILLQNLGYQDTYKGTIRKICRYLNKQKKLKEQIEQKNKDNITQSTQNIQQKNQNDSNADTQHKETQQQRKIRKQEQKKKEEQQAAIEFDEFKKYFQILQKPVGKLLYQLSLERSVQVANLCKQVNMKNMFQKDKGQKLKVNFLVGEAKTSYNSFIDLRIEKQSKSKKNEDIYFIELELTSNSEDNASKIVGYLKSFINMLMQIIVSQNEQLGQIKEIISIEQKVQEKIAKLRISTTDDDVKKFISEFSNTLDQILDTQLTFVIKILYQFNFLLSQIKNSPNAMIQDLFTKDANLKIQYTGSRFLDSVKQLALSQNVFELLRVDTDPMMLAFLGFLSMEKGDIFFKFKKLERTQYSRELTQELLQICSGLQQFQSEDFSLKTLSQLVDGPIKVKIHLEDLKIDININVKDFLKLPFMISGQGNQGYDSD